jgi:prophage regulatory protein
MSNKVYRLKELKEILGVGKSTIYCWIKEGKFPKPIHLGPRCVGWLSSDIEKWLEEKRLETSEYKVLRSNKRYLSI